MLRPFFVKVTYYYGEQVACCQYALLSSGGERIKAFFNPKLMVPDHGIGGILAGLVGVG